VVDPLGRHQGQFAGKEQRAAEQAHPAVRLHAGQWRR
jgi:hypothetical protein